MNSPEAAMPSHPPGRPDVASSHQPCPTCAGNAVAPEGSPDRYVYAIGKLDIRFPSLGIEREFQQRERQMFANKAPPKIRGELLYEVLDANVHVAQRLCYLLLVGGVPAYIVAPSNASLRQQLLNAIKQSSKPDALVIIIGKVSGVSAPGSCGGVMAPIASCDQIYSFTQAEWFESLSKRLQPALKTRKANLDEFRDSANEMFQRLIGSAENVGATDSHRALNYALVQHPGIVLAWTERWERCTLDRIDTRLLPGIGSRRQVAIILTFLDRTTAVPERLACRIDVTEEWPFLASAGDGSPSGALGLMPFVDSEFAGMPY